MKQDYHQPLLPENIYHLFSRAIGNEKLFLSHDNYLYFLQKLKQHICPIADMYSYTLLPNHFHLMVKIKPNTTVIAHFNLVKKTAFNEKTHNLSDFVMERFSNFLNGYTKAFNKMYNRKGALFLDYLKRSQAEDDGSFTSFIFYIHKNAVHHGLAKQIGEWKYDSYLFILSDGKTALLKEDVLKWFRGKEGYIEFHKQQVELKIKPIDV